MIPRMAAIMNESGAKEKRPTVIPAEAGTTARALSTRF